MASDSRADDQVMSQQDLGKSVDVPCFGTALTTGCQAARAARHHVYYLKLSEIMRALCERGRPVDYPEVCDCRFCLTQPMIKTT